ncbi:MAG: GNAT family N-acetyltransferase [Candidatus Obscuribacterales bacterium]|nr:GNAT family N-acetyltransferase [Candidatus Obscuribacterales bacterium]
MLRLLEPREIDAVLKENFKVWSPGLNRSQYRHYQWWQLQQPWGRKHLQYFGYFSDKGELLASCKLYRFEYQSRQKIYSVGGVGAVFVAERNRGHSYGLKMLESLIEKCREDGFDALTLNSDIDPEYYERLGFHLFDFEAFAIELNDVWLRYAIRQCDEISDKSLDESFVVRPVTSADYAEMCKHHLRWLAAQPFGMRRSLDYWSYKLGREKYLQQHSALNWPRQEIVTDNFEKYEGGYALLEQSGRYLRVLEVIGKESIKNSLWAQILRLAQRRQVKTIRGWNVMSPPVRGVTVHQRDWSFPMICPLKEELSDEMLAWTEFDPPSMLELDHF